MKKNIIKFILIYSILIAYLLLSALIYSLYIIKTYNNHNVIIYLIISLIFYMLIGLLYANHFHKKGLIIGILASLSHLLIIKFILYLFKLEPTINVTLTIIYSLIGGIGGFLGIMFKKFI